jgi:soluble lytic murein transglycosylase-like protein
MFTNIRLRLPATRALLPGLVLLRLTLPVARALLSGLVLPGLVLSADCCQAESGREPALSADAPLRESAAWREGMAQLQRYRQGESPAPPPMGIRAFVPAPPPAASRPAFSSVRPARGAIGGLSIAGASARTQGQTVPDWERITRLAGRKYGVETALIMAVLQIESNFNPRAVSPKGALGAMQIMPDTGRQLGLTNFFDPEANTDAGTRYLATMLQAFPRIELALAAYNAGPEAVRHYGKIPPYAETREYVSRVLEAYRKLSAPGSR